SRRGAWDPAAVEGWDADGWAVARRVLDAGTVARLLAHLDRLLADRPDAALSGLLAGTVVDDPVWLEAVADARLLDVVEALVGPGVVLFSSCWVVKPPHRGRAAAWHQDGGTWPLDPLEAVTLWIALDDADAANGALRVIPGSHRGGLLPHLRDDARLATELFNVALPPDAVDEAAAVDVELRAGDVSAHHPALIHGSAPNRSARPRRALVARYHPPTTKVTQPGWPSTVVLRPPTT
ncbi:MAG: phytanoyl-CoA dioxygenase family protein, partial [Actinomycetes bacterium]